MVVTESLCFQMPTNSVGLAKVMNEIIDSFSISKILHPANEAMVHHEAMTLIPTVSNLTRVSAANNYIGFC
jgi:hypothetical protein